MRQVSVRRALLGQKMEEESGQFLQERGERIRYRRNVIFFFFIVAFLQNVRRNIFIFVTIAAVTWKLSLEYENVDYWQSI
jgi:hypothetical protein